MPKGVYLRTLEMRLGQSKRSKEQYKKRSELGLPSGRPREDTAQYDAIHHRVLRARGRPPCQICGVEKTTWALSHDTPKERIRTSKCPCHTGYSMSVEEQDYIPLCYSCHNTYDGIVNNLRG